MTSFRDRPFGAPLNEAEIQRAVFAHLHQRKAAGVFAFHVPMGGYRRPKEAAIFKGMGAKAGVPDVIAVKDGQMYGLELKAPGGSASAKQVETLQEIQRCGAIVAVATGLEAAIRMLEQWGLVKGEST